jgi:ABC-type multidrug transport system fused ATPase/permease subunit
MKTWTNELKKPKPSFTRAIIVHYKWPWIGSLILALISQMLQVLPSILIRNVADWVALPADTRPVWAGWVYLAVIFVSSLLGSALWAHSVLIMVRCGIRIRSTMINSIYRKTLRLSPQQDASSGQILNLMSNDTQRLVETFQWINLGAVAPLTAIVVIGLLLDLLGAFALIGLAVFVILVPLNGIIARKFAILRKLTLQETDIRVQLENELFGSMRAVKFYAWEDAMFEVCRIVRERELNYVRLLGLWRAIMLLLMTSSPTLVAVSHISGICLRRARVLHAVDHFRLAQSLRRAACADHNSANGHLDSRAKQGLARSCAGLFGPARSDGVGSKRFQSRLVGRCREEEGCVASRQGH